METIIRVKNKTKNFSIIDNRFILDKNLSFKAKGILTYLLTRPSDWKVYAEEIASHSTDGIDSVKSGLKELKEAGYVVHQVVREKGRIIAHEYIVYEFPPETEIPQKPEAGKPLMVKLEKEKAQEKNPPVANPALLNTDNILNTDNTKYNSSQSSQYSKNIKSICNNIRNKNDGTNMTDFDFDAYEFIKKQIDFEAFTPEDKKILEAAITGLLAGDFDFKKPRVIVKSLLEKLDYWSAERALDSYRKSDAEKITKPKSYFQQCLLNAVVEHELETGRFCSKLT